MAGLILSLGDEERSSTHRLKEAFEDYKDLALSYAHTQQKLAIFKYGRRYDEHDSNYFESDDVAVCAVGSLLYAGFGFEDSVSQLGMALKEAKSCTELIDRIDGNFLLAIVYKKLGFCELITDFGGVINAYLCESGGNIYVATSMLALARSLPVTPDKDAILMFLRSGMFFDENTYFNEIKVLKPACIYRYEFSGSSLMRTEYWQPPQDVAEDVSLREAMEKTRELLGAVIDRIPKTKALFDFTGGFDARLILAMAYGRATKPLNAFFFGPPESREAKIVRKNCENLGIIYNNYVPGNGWSYNFFDYVLEAFRLSDGLENACVYAPILMIQKMKRQNGFRYSVIGLLGELFRQRTTMQELGKRGKRKPANLKRLVKYRILAGDFDPSAFADPYIAKINSLPARLSEIYGNTLKKLGSSPPNTLQLDYIYFAQRARRWGGRNVTTSNQIIQPICPLWFRKPLEYVMALPPRIKKRSQLVRSVAEKESPRFAEEKMINGAPLALMTPGNLYRFIPGLVFFMRIALRKFSQVFFNKTIWAGLTTPDYNTGQWYRSALADERCKALLDYEKMVSSKFYDRTRFNEFLQRAKAPDFHFYGQLGNIITAELVLRGTGMLEAGNKKYSANEMEKTAQKPIR